MVELSEIQRICGAASGGSIKIVGVATGVGDASGLETGDCCAAGETAGDAVGEADCAGVNTGAGEIDGVGSGAGAGEGDVTPTTSKQAAATSAVRIRGTFAPSVSFPRFRETLMPL